MSNEVVDVCSMSNNLPHKVRKKVVMTEDILTHVQYKYELKDDTIKLCQKIIVEQFNLSRSFEDAFNPQVYACAGQIYPSIEYF